MRNAYRLILGFGIIAFTLLSPQIVKTEQRSVKNHPITDNILRSKIAFAVVNEAIVRGLNLHTLSESDYWKLRGPVLLDPQADIHFQLREQYDRIVNTVYFGAALDAGSPSQNSPISPENRPVLYQKAEEIIRDFIAERDISVIIGSHAPIGIGEMAAIRRLQGEVPYTYEIINSAAVSVPLKNIAALIKLPFITEIWPDSKGSFKLSASVPRIGADVVHNAPPNGLGVTGQGVTVAVVDNGIYNDHPEFKGRIKDSREKVFDGPGEAEDHGTQVTGIIGAADDGVGITGVAPEVSFLDASAALNTLDVLDPTCLGLEPSYCEAMEAIGWAAHKRVINIGSPGRIPTGSSRKILLTHANTKADVINMSVGFYSWLYGREGNDPMSKLIDEVVEEDDIVVVVSAGNEAQGRASGLLPANKNHVDYDFSVISTGAFHVVLLQDAGDPDLDLEIYDSNGHLFCAEYSGWNLFNTSTERGFSYYGISKDYTKVKCNNRGSPFQYTVRVKRGAKNTPKVAQDYELWLTLDDSFKSGVYNSEDTLAVPGYSKKAITVGALKNNHDIWIFSSQGPNIPNQPLKPEVVAPGVSIKTTNLNNKYIYEAGTSMAAPHVAGVAALILDAVGKDKNGKWNFSPDEVKSAIVRGAENLTGQPPDNIYGAGLVKADNIIFGGTVQPGGKLRFKITPRLVKDQYNQLDLDAINVFAAAISWGDNGEVFPPSPPPGTTIPPTQKTATQDLDLKFLDENSKPVLPSNPGQPFPFHTFTIESNYVKARHDTPKDFGDFFYLDVVHRDPNGEPIRFTGASTHPIEPLVVAIPSKVRPPNTTTTAPPQGTSVLNLPEDAKARFGKGNIHHIAYSPDGTLLAAAGRAGVWLYDAETYQAVGYLRGHRYGVSTLAFSPDGKTLATGNSLYGTANTVHLWDVDTKTEKNTLTAGSVYGVAFSPDGKTIATTNNRDPVRLWDVDTGTEKNPVLTGPVKKIAFSPDGKTIATTDGGALVRLWSVSFGVEMKVFTGYNGNIRSIAFSPDGKTIAGGGSDNTVRLWDVDTGETTHRLRGHTREVKSIKFSPDGKTIASGSEDNTVRLWDIETGENKHTLTGDTVLAYNSFQHPDVTFSSDGKTIASVDLDFTVRLWDVETGTEKKTLTGHTSEVHSVAFSPDGQTLASGVMDQTDKNITVRLWDVDTGAEKKTLTAHAYLVYGVAFSPDGKTIATAGDDKTVRLWDVDTGAEKKTLTAHQYRVLSVAFSPDGNILATGGSASNRSNAGIAHLWDVETGENKQTLTHRWAPVHSVAFSPDGKTIATGGYNVRGSDTYLWDVETGENKQTVPGAYSVAFSPDGKTIATASGRSAHLWNLAFDEIKHTFTGPTDTYYGPPPVYSVAFSPDGNTLATGGGTATGGGMVLLWDVKTGESKHTLTGHTAPVRSIAFNLDGDTLASGSEDGTVLLWDVTPYTVEPPAPEYPAWDVNRDGQINIVDVVSVSHYLGEPASAAPRADVNGDGIINILDLLLVSKHIGESTDAAAPARIAKLEGLDRTTVEGWLALARIEDDGSLMFQQGIAYLERLLAVFTPKETALLRNYPNPFNPETWIPYQLATPADVTLTIYDIQGRVVRDLDLGHQRAGMYQSKSRAAYWDGRNAVGEPVASGVYFYTLTAGDFSATRKLLIRK